APHPRFKGKSELDYRGDAMVQLDWATGEILQALEDNGLADNTLVIFSSDNGPVYDDGYEDGTTVPTSTKEVDRGHDASGPYRGGKYQIYEGGTRVPFIVKWPGHVQPGKSDAMVNQIDFLASFADLLGIDLKEDQGIDSRNTMAALLGKEAEGNAYMIEESGAKLALRRGAWKYIQAKDDKTGELYNLDSDIGEQNDVAREHHTIAEEMEALLRKLVDAKDGIRKIAE
ncbi:MAG: sulfatase-like hydrolase/transferase, partial [Planctomycetota bacterium]